MSNQVLANKKILIVDDFEMGRTIMKKAVKELGCKSIEEAEDGLVAMEKIKDAVEGGRGFDMIFCDWNMPEASGIEVLRFLKADVKFAQTFFVMVTAVAEQMRIVEALEAGAADYIVKPIAAEVLLRKVARLVSEGPSAEAKGA